MSTPHFDTLRYFERLKAAGVPEDVAKAQSAALAEAFSESVDTRLATKLDVAEIRSELRTHSWMLGTIVAGIVALFVRTFF